MTAATVSRRDDWEGRLDAHVAASLKQSFCYGTFDCCTFVADAILSMTGVDVMRKLRGYKGTKGARDLLKSLGGMEKAAEIIAAENGMDEVVVTKAHRGDMILIRGRRPAVGILGLDGSWVMIPNARGIYRIPLGLCARAWRVG